MPRPETNARRRTRRRLFAITLAALVVVSVGAWGWASSGRSTSAPCMVWTIAASPKLEGGILKDVDASASDDVWAVGENGSLYGLVEHFDGSTWTLTTQPGVVNGLTAVAAVSPADVWAGGYKVDLLPQAFTEHWDGATWSSVPTPTPGIESRVESMVTLSSTDVWAAGYWIDALNGGHPLYLHWDGMVWALLSGPADRGQLAYALAAVSPSDIWAFGGQASPQPFANVPMSQHWDGSTWTDVRPASIPGQGNRQLLAGAAISATDVWVVGYGEYSGTAIEHWNGNRWRYLRGPNAGILQGADAAASNDVWTVGQYGTGPGRATSEHWDGTSWTALPTPNPGHNSQLFGVAVFSTTDIWGVGWYAEQEFGGNTSPLILHSEGDC